MTTVEFNDGNKFYFSEAKSTYTEDGWVYLCDDDGIVACFPKEAIRAILFDKAGEKTSGD